MEIETPNWNINDTEAMKLHREGKDKKIRVSEITSHAPPPFYKGKVPFTYKVGYEEIAPSARIVVYYDFYKGSQNCYIYEYGNDTLFPTPDGAITLDELGNKLAEARAVGIGTYDIVYADGTYKTENFLKIEEFYYKNGRLIFYCNSLIRIAIHGDKIAEIESAGKKDKEYYFMYPVVPS